MHNKAASVGLIKLLFWLPAYNPYTILNNKGGHAHQREFRHALLFHNQILKRALKISVLDRYRSVWWVEEVEKENVWKFFWLLCLPINSQESWRLSLIFRLITVEVKKELFKIYSFFFWCIRKMLVAKIECIWRVFNSDHKIIIREIERAILSYINPSGWREPRQDHQLTCSQ